MLDVLRAVGWALLTVVVVALAVLVTVGALLAHGAESFARWVGWSTVAALPVAMLGLVMALKSIRDVTADTKVTEETLDQRLGELADSMRASARLVEQITAELDVRAATAKTLKDEAETAKAVAALHRDQTEAVRRMLDGELTWQARRIRRDALKIGVASFIAGGGVTYLVTLLVHPLH